MTLLLNNCLRAFPSHQNNSTSTSFSSASSESFSSCSRGGFIVRASKKKRNHLVAHFHREKTHRQQSHHHRRRRRGVGVAAEQQENNNEKNFQTGEKLDEKVSLFGITHTQKEYEAAEYIMKSRPKFVVCETAVSAGHGEQHGNMVTFEQGVQQMMIDPTLDEALTFVTRLAGEMK